MIDSGSIVHESTIKIPTSANDIALLAAFTQDLSGHYMIGKNFHHNTYLQSNEIIQSCLKIIYQEYKHSQTTILPQSECKQEKHFTNDQSIEQELQHLRAKTQKLQDEIAKQNKILAVKRKQFTKLLNQYNVCSMLHVSTTNDFTIMLLCFYGLIVIISLIRNYLTKQLIFVLKFYRKG